MEEKSSIPWKFPFKRHWTPIFSFSLALPRHQAVGAALFVRGRALFWLRLRGQRVARYRDFQVDIGKSRVYSMYISIYYLYVYIYQNIYIYIQELHIYLYLYIYNILSISMIFNCPDIYFVSPLVRSFHRPRIMIVCGDFIDAQFGVMFGLTTMASAGATATKQKPPGGRGKDLENLWKYRISWDFHGISFIGLLTSSMVCVVSNLYPKILSKIYRCGWNSHYLYIDHFPRETMWVFPHLC